MTELDQIRDEIKRRLNRYRDLLTERDQLVEELQRVEALMASPTSQNLDGMPRSGSNSSSPVERIVIKHIDLEDRYRAQIARMMKEQKAIEVLIEGLEPTERRLTRFRYIDGLSWDAVCDKMNYSWRQTHRIHGRMLDKLVAAELERRNAQK